MHPTLQMLEAHGLSVGVERDDLAVEYHRPVEQDTQGLQAPGYVGELGGLVIAEPRPKAHRWASGPGAGSIAAIARIPSYLRSYASSGELRGAVVVAASIGRTDAGSSRHMRAIVVSQQTKVKVKNQRSFPLGARGGADEAHLRIQLTTTSTSSERMVACEKV